MSRQQKGPQGQRQQEISPITRDIAAKWTPVSSLKGWERNPRKHGETVPKLVRAIIRYGWGSPIEARAENLEVIAGHGRMQAAQRLVSKWGKASGKRREKWHPEAKRVGETGEVPVRLRDLDEDDAHQAAIADNRIGQESSWDSELLASHVDDFEDDVDLMGFDDNEVEKLLDYEEPDEESGERALKDYLTYQVVVSCASESHQTELITRFESEGLKCKPLIS